MKILFKVVTFLLISILLSNCIGIRSKNYSTVTTEELKAVSAKKSKIYIDLDYRNLMQQLPRNARDKDKSDQRQSLVTAINESNCCEVVKEKNEADIFIDGIYHNESSELGIYAAYISGMTFTIIPCWVNSKMRITAKVTKGKIVKDYDVKDSMFGMIWAPLIIVAPFLNMVKTENEVHENLYKNLVLQIKKDGFFEGK